MQATDTSSKLIVNYIPQTMTEDQLRQLFAPYGNIVHCKLMIDRRVNLSMGYAFIAYSTPEESANAIAALNGKQLENKRLKISYARPSSPEIQNSNLYVSGLAGPYLEKDKMVELFSPYGTVIDAKVLTDPVTQVPRGVGFIRFATHAEAQRAIDALHNTTPPPLTKPLQVKVAESFHGPLRQTRRLMMKGGIYPLGSQGEPACLFVYGLPSDCDEAVLYRLFSPFGAIGNVKLIRDLTTGQCKGFAFVNFMRVQEAQNAVLNLNGFVLRNRQLQVGFKTEKVKTASAMLSATTTPSVPLLPLGGVQLPAQAAAAAAAAAAVAAAQQSAPAASATSGGPATLMTGMPASFAAMMQASNTPGAAAAAAAAAQMQLFAVAAAANSQFAAQQASLLSSASHVAGTAGPSAALRAFAPPPQSAYSVLAQAQQQAVSAPTQQPPQPPQAQAQPQPRVHQSAL